MYRILLASSICDLERRNYHMIKITYSFIEVTSEQEQKGVDVH